jgi:zinc D-Ala-D-Ala carboxypeptidase
MNSMLRIAQVTMFLSACVVAEGLCTQDPAYKQVSKTISLSTYAPDDIVTFEGVPVSKRIVEDLKKLLAAAHRGGLELKVVSGYRSYQRQEQVFNGWDEKELKKHPDWTREQAEQEANSYSARPGHSEHQLGTTVDVLSAENNYQFSSDPKLKYIAWLENNCQKYNFKISYPKTQKEYVYEPWHVRWYPVIEHNMQAVK